MIEVLKLKSYGLEMVKAFSDSTEVNLAPITVFVGQNSCGKSSFIRFPVLLHQAIKDDIYPIRLHSESNDLVDYGDFRDVSYNHTEEPFVFKFSYDYNQLLPGIYERMCNLYKCSMPEKGVYYTSEDAGTDGWVKNLPVSQITTRITYMPSPTNEAIIISRYEILFDGLPAFLISLEKNTGEYTFHQYRTFYKGNIITIDYSLDVHSRNDALIPHIDEMEARNRIISDVIGLDEDGYIALKDRAIEAEDSTMTGRLDRLDKIKYVLELYRPARQISLSQYNEILDRIRAFEFYVILQDYLSVVLQAELKSLSYIGPFRDNPERVYRRDKRDISIVGKNGEFATKMLINDYQGTKAIIRNVSRWFEKVLNYKLKIKRLKGSEFYQIVLENMSTKTESNIMDVGYGIPQILPIVCQIVQASIHKPEGQDAEKMNKTIIIEQPELHLHPNAQAELAKLFASAVIGHEKSTLLIETHSEHLIRGLQMLIADDHSVYHIRPDQIKIYYVHSKEEADNLNVPIIEEMKMNDYGQFLKKWPDGFFDKAYMMTSAMMSVISSRKRKDGRRK